MTKDVHTEHCCVLHGCKYGDSDCTVTSKIAPQSYMCESCNYDGILTVEEATNRAVTYSKTNIRTSYTPEQRKFAVNVLRLAYVPFEKIAYLNDTDLDILMKETVRDVKT